LWATSQAGSLVRPEVAFGRWRSAFRALRVVLGCVLLTTCGSDSLAPRPPIRGEVDLSSLMAMRDFPIPIDRIAIQLLRFDQTIAFDRVLTSFDIANGSYRVPIEVELRATTETFQMHAEVRVGDFTYFEVNSTVTATAGRTITTDPIVPTYVGPGATADSMVLRLTPPTAVAGTSVSVVADVYEDDDVVPGVPVDFAVSDSQAIPIGRVGMSSATISPSATADGEYTVTARTPTGMTSQATLTIVSATSDADSLVIMSPATQSGTVNQPVASVPIVRVLDENDQPLANVPVTFIVTSGGGTITGGSALSDSEGDAALGSWRLGQTAGANTVQATVSGVAPVTFTATGTPTAPLTIAKISGDAQSDSAGRALPQALVAEVRDSFANPIPNQAFSWAATDGTLGTPTGTTNTQGRATTTWTLGLAQASPTATITAGPAQTIFTATTLFGQPTILLSWAGVPGVGIGLTATVNVNVTNAPPARLAVALASSNTGLFTVSAPDTVYINAGQTTGSKVINGVSTGTATLNASAPGYANGSLTVAVQNRNISLPPTLNVPYGQTASLPIQLPAPAPAGGVTFTVVSSDPTRISVATPSVTIAAGGQTANATLNGVLPGPAVITVANPAYVTGTSQDTTRASLVFTVGSVNVNPSFGASAAIQFQSNNVATAAPVPGIGVTFTSLDPTCVAVQSPRTIPAGQSSVSTDFSYGGSATLPCNTSVVATATNLTPDTIPVSASAAPTIALSLSSGGQLGQRLQETGFFSLSASNHGGVTVTLTSSDPDVVLSTGAQTAGTTTLQIPILAGGTSASFFAQSKGTDSTVATVTATAAGFADGTLNVSVVAPAVELQGVPITTTTLATSTVFYAQVGLPNVSNTALTRVQNVSPGLGAPVRATFTSESPAIGVIVDSLNTPAGAATGMATIAPGFYYTTTNGVPAGSVAFRPLTAGDDTVNVALPGFVVMSTGRRGVSVTQPTISASIGSVTIGSGLQEAGSVALNNGAQHGGATVTLTSSDPAVLRLSRFPDSAGSASIQQPLANGVTFFSYYAQIQDGATGPVNIIVSEPRFVPDTITVTGVTPAIELQGVPTSIPNLTAPFAVYAQVGLPNGDLTALTRVQSRRATGAPVVVTFTSDNAAVVRIVDSANAPTGAASGTAELRQQFYYTPSSGPATGGIALLLAGAGNDSIGVTAPGFTALRNARRGITVTQPTLDIGVSTSQVGSGLQESGFVSLSSGSHGGASVTVTSLVPGTILVDTLPDGPGHASIVKPLANGQTSFSYYVQAIEGQTGTVRLRVTEPRFVSDSVDVTAVTPGVELAGVPGTMTTLTPPAAFYAQVGTLNGQSTALNRVQNVRGGAPGPLVVTMTANPASIVAVVDSSNAPLGAATATVRIPKGLYYTPSNGAATGGTEVRPILNGAATVSVSIPGYTTATTNGNRSISVSQPGISGGLSFGQVGSGLQESGSVSLQASNHGGVDVTLTSSDPSIVLLAPNNTTAGTASIQVHLANGQTSFSFYVQALEGKTGTPTVTVTAPGFTNATLNTQVVVPAIDLQGVQATWTVAQGDYVVYSQTGVPNGQLTGLSRGQYVRPAAPAPIVVTFTSSNPTAGVMRNSGGDGASRTASIGTSGNEYYTPLSVASGGVAFHPLAPGSGNVSVTSPGFIVTASPRGFAIQ
jgi:hypothetical protein